MVAAPAARICDRCVEVCSLMIAKQRGMVAGADEYASWFQT